MKKVIVVALTMLLLVSCAKVPAPIVINVVDPNTGEIYTTTSMVPAKIHMRSGDVEYETDTRPIAPVYKQSGILEQAAGTILAVAVPVIVSKKIAEK